MFWKDNCTQDARYHEVYHFIDIFLTFTFFNEYEPMGRIGLYIGLWFRNMNSNFEMHNHSDKLLDDIDHGQG